MFESAEIGHKISKTEFRKQEPGLRDRLINAQSTLREKAGFPLLIIIGGVDGAGKGETVNLLNQWMDPRHIVTRAFGEPTDEETQRPRMWRFWRSLPAKGRTGILFGSWYTQPILDRVVRKTRSAELTASIEEIRHFEQMLVDEGALVLKFWFHLSKDAQKKRLNALHDDPKTRWRVTDSDWDNFKLYDRFRSVSEQALRETSTGDAPWFIVEGADPNYRHLTVGHHILTALEARLAAPRVPPAAVVAPRSPPLDQRNVLNVLDYDASLSKDDYRRQLEKYQGELNLLTRDKGFRKRSMVMVFEGNDAAGKGGTIRRITAALDARFYRVIPIAAPTAEELAQPYLWRFWRNLPGTGQVAIFDRSWYGRVLVERVEGYCSEADWMRAYHEINDFEEQLVRHEVTLLKFWLAITPEEQLKRFTEREQTSFKNYKITDDDWRNRDKWPDYEHAVCDMVERSSTNKASWTLVPANDKRHARIEVLKTLCETLEQDR